MSDSFGDCSHDTFERFGDTNGVYQCADCGRYMVIGEFRWLAGGPNDYAVGDGDDG